MATYNNISYGNYGFDLAVFAPPAEASARLAAQNIRISHNLLGKSSSLPQDAGLFAPVYAYAGDTSLLGDPQFFAPERGDFRLRPSSPAWGKGKTPYHDYNPPVHLGAEGIVPYAELPGKPLVPQQSGAPWQICTLPDLDSLNGPDLARQHIVDHGFVQDDVGDWHLWACMRGTAVGRLLYAWRGKNPTQGPWQPVGIAARADSSWGERIKSDGEESIQAPHFVQANSGYYCFYNSNGSRLMFSADGRAFRRVKLQQGNNVMFARSGRDLMLLREGNRWLAYGTRSAPAAGWGSGQVVLRTSPDLKRWSDYTIVSAGG